MPTVGNIGRMTLKDYIAAHGLSLSAFGEMLDPPVSEHAVRKWVYNQRTPDPENALAIERATGGAVSASVISPIIAQARNTGMSGEAA